GELGATRSAQALSRRLRIGKSRWTRFSDRPATLLRIPWRDIFGRFPSSNATRQRDWCSTGACRDRSRPLIHDGCLRFRAPAAVRWHYPAELRRKNVAAIEDQVI